MGTVLITGAGGNVGKEVLRSLNGRIPAEKLLAGVRAPDNKQANRDLFGATPVLFDFEKPATFASALAGCSSLFLLRPPQLTNVQKYIKPLLDAAKTAGVRHLVFLSVQGVEQSTLIPHHKIEALIRQSGIAFTMLRPAYFMQNFTTTLSDDLLLRRRIFLPAGEARFTLVDVRDVGAVAAEVLLHPDSHRNKFYDLTSPDLLSFQQMADIISVVTNVEVHYHAPTLFRFFLEKSRQGTPVTLVLVMMLLHYLPRFRKEPPRTRWIEQITGRPAVDFMQFVKEHAHLLAHR